MIRLLLADGHRSFVEALGMRLRTEPGLQVVAAVARRDEALRVVRTRAIDVAALTVSNGQEDGIGTGADLLAARPRLRLVAVAERDDVGLLAQAVRAGFQAWVPKNDGVVALVDAVAAVLRDETRIPPLLLTRLLHHLLHEQEERRAAEDRLACLTARERQILDALVTGATRREIAEDFAISANTVRTHVQSVLTKLGVHTSLAAVALARRTGVG